MCLKRLANATPTLGFTGRWATSIVKPVRLIFRAGGSQDSVSHKPASFAIRPESA